MTSQFVELYARLEKADQYFRSKAFKESDKAEQQRQIDRFNLIWDEASKLYDKAVEQK